MGRIVSIKRMAVHDGGGIRTTLFLKGCPLRCVWCHNPESISSQPQTAYFPHKCVGCGECASLCSANILDAQGHRFDRSACAACGRCAERCLGEAFAFYGQETTPKALLPLLLEDREFFDHSGGGVTLSGGEPLLQPGFSAEILKGLKREGIHTAVDTCGFADTAAVEAVLPYTDCFLYDLKAADPEVHRRLTGQSNRVILENLRFLCAVGAAVEVRVPYVPGMNGGQMEGIAALLRGLPVRGVRLLPYHPYAASKYESLGMPNPMPPAAPPGPKEMERAVALFRAQGIHAVNGGNLP